MPSRRYTAWFFALLLVAACGKPEGTVTTLNGRGFGGEDTIASSLTSNRLRGINAITAYLNKGDAGGALCNQNLVRDDSFLYSTLGVLTSDPSGTLRANVEAAMMGRAELLEWRDALITTTMKVTDNAADVTYQGVVQDAFTVGLQITFYRPAVAAMSEDRRVALEFHEASHAEKTAWLDTQLIAGMNGRQAINIRAACFVAYLRALEASH